MLICLTTLLLNITNIEFNKQDYNALKRAKYVCSSDARYKDTPCLKRFLKKETRVYWAICGEKELYVGTKEELEKYGTI
jgi:hypothetical protein